MITNDSLQTAVNTLTAAIKENFPDIDTNIGSPSRETMINLGAFIYAIIQDRIDTFALTNSLKALQENPTYSDSATLDAILSNWFAAHNPGEKATGFLQVIYASNINYYIPEDTEFITTGGLIFYPTAAYLIEPEDLADDTSLKLYPLNDDSYYALVPVTAAEVGEDYAVEQGTQFNVDLSADIINVVAWSTFGGAVNAETPTEAITRVQEAITIRELTTNKAISSVLIETYPTIKGVKVLGYSSRELQRNKSNLMGIGVGALGDVLLNTGSSTRVLIKEVDANGQFVLEGTDEVPFYRITKINKTNQPDLPTEEYTVTYNIAGGAANILPGVKDARYSPYEVATVTLLNDTFKNSTVQVTQSYPPNISEVQTFVNDSDNRSICMDLLIRGIIPCYIDVEATVKFLYDDDNEDAIRQAIQSYVNTASEITASHIIDIIKNYDNVDYVSLPLKIYGKLYVPNSVLDLRDLYTENVLEIPTDYEYMLSSDTVAYYNGTITFIEA